MNKSQPQATSDKSQPDSQIEYRIQGLSCANCAREMQEEIQKLEHGKNASILYNSGRLLVSPKVDLARVKKILKRDGATLVSPLEQGSTLAAGGAPRGNRRSEHSHAHGHGHNNLHGHVAHRTSDGHSHDDAHHHGHSHEHAGSRLGKWLLGIAAALYLATFVLDSFMPDSVLILMYLSSIAISGYSTFIRGLRNLTRLKFNMDTLMTVAMVGAVLIGEWKEATLVAILFGLNELLEGYGMSRARKSMEALLSAAPKQAVLITSDGELTVPITSLEAGDRVLVRAGEKIPSDGTIMEGHSAVNEAAITGESIPVPKEPGHHVFGGSVNTDGLLRIRIDKAYEESSLARIMHLVQEAQDTKTPTELFIDKFAKYYTPAIMIIAALVVLVPPLLFGQSWMKWIYEGLAILIVGCPCALVLSSPIALVSGMTRCARNGVLVKGGVHLEQLGKINAVAFDKTGTLTIGLPSVRKEIVYDTDHFHLISAAMEAGSLHPLAEAIVRQAESQGIPVASLPQPTELVTLPGVGLSAEIEGVRYWAGSEELLEKITLEEHARQQVLYDLNQLKTAGLTVVLIADHHHVLGLYGLADELRPESPNVIADLHRNGIVHTVMLTGDHAESATTIAAQAGVSDWAASLLPEQKVERVRKLSESWNVAMVGDGINDAPALAASNLGIAMGKGTDTAVETADIVLMQDHLGKLPGAIKVARQVNRVIVWNIGISLTLKLIALLLTIPGWLTLWIAVMSDMGATIVVTLLGLTVLLGRDAPAHRSASSS
ncbi:heavy metal translocating P-type ATPase [Paenibacillus lentus]|uniref:Cd(2+)-exporting ATPase n=1 Tax=Paenibacillus lentus TaxID=1338368 RepID=A0A3Q8S9H4_9BACL|nr:heavy metal translocating P-type ATPase [Paenibacillus lentus]AZK45485.1 cadmium-translocating P-type ATPase [Paenibacillus lentus]